MSPCLPHCIFLPVDELKAAVWQSAFANKFPSWGTLWGQSICFPSMSPCMTSGLEHALRCRNVVMERARVCPLAWGNAEQQTAIAHCYGRFDTIVGADVVYVPEAMQSLFATCCALLTLEAHATLVFCHIVRRISEESIIAMAAHFGLRLQEHDQSFVVAASEAINDGPFRLLIFCRA